MCGLDLIYSYVRSRPLSSLGSQGLWSSGVEEEGPHALVLYRISCIVFWTCFSKSVFHFIDLVT